MNSEDAFHKYMQALDSQEVNTFVAPPSILRYIPIDVKSEN